MESYLKTLREHGLKITPLRMAMLEVFRKKQEMLSVNAMCRAVRRRIPNAGLQSVYRNLADFAKVGIAEELFLERRKNAYALCSDATHHHHHVVCRRCRRSTEVKACEMKSVARAMKQSSKHLKESSGFLVERHFLQLEGLCRECQKN